jgi:hypothetical protein
MCVAGRVMHVKEIECDGVDWFYLAQDADQWRFRIGCNDIFC